MELKTLRNFLEIAHRGNFSAAAKALNLSQPALSKQIMDLEEELGAKLFLRGKRKTVLTEAGKYLLKNADEIVELAEKTRKNIGGASAVIAGDIYIAGGETKTMSILARAIRCAREKYPGLRFHLFSGNAEAVSDRLAKGLADFGTFVLPASLEMFDYINLPMNDRWGLLMRRDHPLASRLHVSPADLPGQPLICSAQRDTLNEIQGWMGKDAAPLDIVATYTLLYNAALLVQEGIGLALCLDGIADVSSCSNLCFRPLAPPLDVQMAIAWKRSGVHTRAAALFQEILYMEAMNYKEAQSGCAAEYDQK